MHVVATAGHVDHGKSTLVRALTGTDPDRLAQEKVRGLTLDLGFAWTSIDGDEVAFVDVPGHERFVSTMLAGVGPVPVVLLVVAADGGWMPQSQEHLDALDALGVRSGLLVVTRSDLADPQDATAVALQRVSQTSLHALESVAVSARTGAGLDELRTRLAALLRAQPVQDPAAPVRLWVDRAFALPGAGTVVTGTLPAGRLTPGDRLVLTGGTTGGDASASDAATEVVVRGLQCLGRTVDQVEGPARAAVSLRGVSADEVPRGSALLTPESHWRTSSVDVRWRTPRRSDGDDADLPREVVLHVGSAAVPARTRRLAPAVARLTLRRPLPLHVGDVCVLRDPGRRAVLAGATVLDVAPQPLTRRGAAAAVGRELLRHPGRPDAAFEIIRRQAVRRRPLEAMGVSADDIETTVAQGGALEAAGWVVDAGAARRLRERLTEQVVSHHERAPLSRGLPLDAARRLLGLPSGELVRLVVGPPLALRAGVVAHSEHEPLPARVRAALIAWQQDATLTPYTAPERPQLQELGLGTAELAACIRCGALVRLDDGVYLFPDAVASAAEVLRRLPSPFSVGDARRAWQTTRRVATPLLELLDRSSVTHRLPDGRRTLPAPRPVEEGAT